MNRQSVAAPRPLPLAGLAVSAALRNADGARLRWPSGSGRGSTRGAMTSDRPRETGENPGGRRFWERLGAEFPDLRDAPSTASYRRDEQALLRRYLPALDGCRLLKTDLWDEAKNTRILHWAASQGAIAFGVDISRPIVERAIGESGGAALHAAVADTRALPFADGSFDAVYSMGTVEHFAETDAAVREIFRVLRPGGRAIVGVPNRHDPFLRPLLVAALRSVGLYAYGYEKSYSRRDLRRLLEQAGFRVVAESGVLFMPGGLRMLDLACHTWWPRLAWAPAVAVHAFAAVTSAMPALRRHGYLLASVGERP